ncbi:response regulator transcription factor [Saltatorellus ferox]
MRLLVVEDSARLRASLATGLGMAGFAVDVAATGPEGLVLAANNPLDVIVLDLGLPGMDGLEVLSRLRERGVETPVLILTARDEVEDFVRGFDAGAHDYVAKPFAMEELVARCQSLARRSYGSIGLSVPIGTAVFFPAGRRLERDGEDIPLKARDMRILEYLVARRGEAVTREEIEDHVYRTKDLPSSNAVDSAICLLRRKLDADGEPSLIQTIRGVGYKLQLHTSELEAEKG